MYLIVTYSYLLLPIAFLLFKCKIKDRIPITLLVYGIACFGLLFIYDDFPKDIRIKYVQPIYTILEYSFFAYIFLYNIQNKVFKSVIIVASLMFVAFQIFFATSVAYKRLDSTPIGIETILLLIYIFYFFYEFSKQIKNIFIYNHHSFWIAVGIMIYLGGSFFFYILINSLAQSEVDKYGNLTYVAEIIKNFLFIFSIFIYKKFPINKNPDRLKNIPNLDMI